MRGLLGAGMPGATGLGQDRFWADRNSVGAWGPGSGSGRGWSFFFWFLVLIPSHEGSCQLGPLKPDLGQDPMSRSSSANSQRDRCSQASLGGSDFYGRVTSLFRLEYQICGSRPD